MPGAVLGLPTWLADQFVADRRRWKDQGMDEDDFYSDQTSFVDCTCEHEPDEHGWMSCDVEDCPCEGHWEE